MCNLEETARDSRPERMYQNSRPTVEAFADGEMLYYRVGFDGFTQKEDGAYQIEPDAVRPPDQSVSRNNGIEQFGQPEDVLWDSRFGIHHAEDGIAEIPASAIPERLQVEESPIAFTCRPTHVPLSNNYAHSEIRMLQNRAFKVGVSNKKARAEYRTSVANASRPYALPPNLTHARQP